MTDVQVKDKEIVVPGEILAKGMGYVPGAGTYRNGEDIISERLGVVSIDGRAVKLIPLSGRYLPKRGDTIICKVVDVTLNGWRLETNSAYQAMLGLKEATSEFIARGADLRKYYDIGDFLVCKVSNVTSQMLVDVMMKGPGLKKLKGGRIIEVNSYKVPRIIGKHGSMISMIKEATGCWIIVGQNGLVWLQGEPPAELLAIHTIRMIESESHLGGLTSRIKDFLEKETGKKLEVKLEVKTE
ncbi:MAG TPA: exosome complex RNA-binding protein Rrp4 [Candidatus Nanoarchaeia archaeon]|nr:exosome complex RNA-binding protein Rrp4 [Candidatus Nanoarchaeia archaeon]